MSKFEKIQFERYHSSLISEFFWSLQNVVDVLRGRNTHKQSFSEQKVSFALNLLQTGGGTIGAAVSLVGGIGLGMFGDRKEKAKADTLTPELLSGSWKALRIIVEEAALQSVDRYRFYLSHCTESDAVELGKVSANRVWEYIPRKHLSFTVENILLGIYKGKSGRWIDSWTNNQLTGLSAADIEVKETSRQNAEGVLRHSGMAFYDAGTKKWQYFIHPRDKDAQHKPKYGFMLVKSEEFKTILIDKEKYTLVTAESVVSQHSDEFDCLWSRSLMSIPAVESSPSVSPSVDSEPTVIATLSPEQSSLLSKLESDWCSFVDWQSQAEETLKDLAEKIKLQEVAIASVSDKVEVVTTEQSKLSLSVESVMVTQELQNASLKSMSKTVAEISERKKNTYIPTPYFQPRKSLWSQIESRLISTRASNEPLVLVGSAGMGKSCLAAQWLHKQKFSGRYQTIRKFTMDSANIEVNMLEVAYDLGVNTLKRDMKDWLSDVSKRMQQESWLMLWDNVDSFESIRAYLPYFTSVTDKQQLLITTRQQSTSWKDPLEVDTFSADESIQYIQYQMKAASSPHFNKDHASSLADLLGHHPLALELALGSVCLYQRTLSSFTDELMTAGVSSLTSTSHKIAGQGATHSTKTLSALWTMSLQDLSADAIFLLQCMSFVSPNGVRQCFLVKLLEGGDEDRCCEALLELRQRSLVQAVEVASVAGQSNQECWRMHRLLQDVVRLEALKLDSFEEMLNSLLLQLKETYFPTIVASNESNHSDVMLREGVVHANVWLTFETSIAKVIAEDKFKCWYRTILSLIANGESALSMIDLSRKHMTQLYRLYKSDASPDHHQIGVISHNIGSLYLNIGDYAEAEQYFLEALEYGYSEHGKDGISNGIAITLNALGNLYLHQDDYSKAGEYLVKAMTMFMMLDQANTTNLSKRRLGTTISTMGYCFIKSKDTEKAKSNLEAALMIFTGLCPNGDEEIVNIYTHMASLCSQQNDSEGAIKYSKMSLDCARELHGELENHDSVATALNNLAYLYDQADNRTQACTLYLKSLGMKRALNNNRPNASIAKTLSNLASCYMGAKNYPDAKKYFLEALNVYESLEHAQDVCSIVSILSSLGQVAMMEHDFPSAKNYLVRALTVAGEDVSANLVLPHLADLYQQLSDNQECIVTLHKLLQLQQSITKGPSHKHVETLSRIGKIHMSIQEPQKAIVCFMSALEMIKALFGDTKNINEANMMVNLGEAFQAIGDGTNAVDAFEIALAIFHHNYDPQHHYDIAVVNLAVGLLYKRSGPQYAHLALPFIQACYVEYMYINTHGQYNADIVALRGLLGEADTPFVNVGPSLNGLVVLDKSKSTEPVVIRPAPTAALTAGPPPQEAPPATEEQQPSCFETCLGCCMLLFCCPCVVVGYCCCSKDQKQENGDDETNSKSFSIQQTTESPMAR